MTTQRDIPEIESFSNHFAGAKKSLGVIAGALFLTDSLPKYTSHVKPLAGPKVLPHELSVDHIPHYFP